MNRQPFRPPSRWWLSLIVPLVVAAMIWTAYSASILLSTEEPTLAAKYKVIAGVIALFAAISLSVGYTYIHWAAPMKNQLYQLLKQNKHLVTFQFDRYIINVHAFRDVGIDPRSFKRLQPRDIKDVVERL